MVLEEWQTDANAFHRCGLTGLTPRDGELDIDTDRIIDDVDAWVDGEIAADRVVDQSACAAPIFDYFRLVQFTTDNPPMSVFTCTQKLLVKERTAWECLSQKPARPAPGIADVRVHDDTTTKMGAHVINTMLGLFLVGLSWGLYVLLPVLIGYAVWQGFRQGIRPAITSVGMYTVATFVMPLLCLFFENTA